MINHNGNGFVRVAGLVGMAVPVLSTGVITLAISKANWFSWTWNYLSDLGIQEGSKTIFNYGLVFCGALLIVFALGLMRFLGGTKLLKAGKALFLTSSISLIGVGIFNEDYGSIHFAVSFAFFFLTLIAILLIGVALRREMDGAGTIFILAALAGGMMWALPWPGRGGALPEATSILFMSIFSIVMGARMYRP